MAIDRGNDQNWMTLGAAAEQLGVSESTVRRWADAGHLQSYRTRGGHRRVLEDDVKTLLASKLLPGSNDPLRITDLALARVRRRLAHAPGAPGFHGGPFEQLDNDTLERLRFLGRQMVDLFARIISTGARGDRYREDARLIGREYGRTLVSGGVGLGEAVATFNMLRRSLDETASQIARESGLSIEEAVDGIEEVLDLSDLVLEGLAQVYERNHAASGDASA
jgi:excisionase family DNA binding protein